MKILRNYTEYKKYIDHQKEKSLNLDRIDKWLNEDWQPKVDMFTEHFKRNKKYLKTNGDALGICARTGQEIEALNNLKMVAVGIDIVPHPPLVKYGDAHELPFENDTFDFVFSNSLDHSIYPNLFISEMIRVLKIGAYGMLHLQITDKVDNYAENIITSDEPILFLLTDTQIMENRAIKDICYHREIIFKKL